MQTDDFPLYHYFVRFKKLKNIFDIIIVRQPSGQILVRLIKSWYIVAAPSFLNELEN